MPRLALLLCVVFVLVAFVWRGWLQLRRTGDSGFRGLSGAVGSAEWIGGVLLAFGFFAALASPILQLLGVLAPIAALSHSALHALGFVLGCAGLVVTVAAQLQMGSSWRVGVDARETTPLVTRGLFGVVRNPIFSAMLLGLLGLFLLAPNALSLLALLGSLAGIEIHVRRVEEPYLVRTHGERYAQYARAVGRFVPGLGRAG